MHILFYYLLIHFFVCRNEVVLPEKKRAHDGTLITGEKSIVRKVRTFTYPDLNKVLILPDTKQKTESIKKTKRRNPLLYLMLSKYDTYFDDIFCLLLRFDLQF